MGLPEVTAAVLRTAHEQVTRAEREARDEAARIVASAREKVSAIEREFDQHTNELLNTMTRREHANTNTRQKAVLLQAKRHALTEAFAQARERLVTQTGTERVRLIEAVCARATRELGKVTHVVCASSDEKTVRATIPTVTVSTDETIGAGIIASDATGRVRVDLSANTLISIIYERETTALADILFANEKTTQRTNSAKYNK